MKKTLKTITVQTDEQNPLNLEIVAEEIVKISDAFDVMRKSRLKERAILLLIRDAMPGAKIGLGDIKMVLDSASSLKREFVYSLPSKA